MNKTLYLRCCIVLFVALFFSCTEKKQQESILIDYEKIDSVNFFSNDVFSKVTPIYLDTNGKMFSDWNQVSIKNDNIYILDKQQLDLTVFDKNGNFKFKISDKGRGPNEYIALKDMFVSGNGEINLLCDNESKVQKYSKDGNFISSTSLSFNVVSMFQEDSGNYLFFKDRITDSLLGDNMIIRTDANFDVINSSLPMDTFIFGGIPETNFSSNSNGSVLAKHYFDNNLYRVYPDTLYTIYTIDFGNKSYPEEFFKSDDFMTVYEIFSKKTYANIEYAFENDDYLLLFIAEDHMEVSSSKVYFLYNKKLGTGEYQLFSSSSILLNAIGKPIDLTPNNEIVFLINSDLLGELKESYPLFDSINDNEGYVVAYLQIK